jgi:DNA-binding transcriptional MerR regulator
MVKFNSMDKRYYVAQVVKMLGISRKTLYLWEAAGKIPKPRRDPMSRYRYWTKAEVANLKKMTGRNE